MSFTTVSADGMEETIVKKAGNSSKTTCPQERPMMCTMDYMPVCGVNIEGQSKTYANGCGACSDVSVVSYTPAACPERILSAAEVTKLFSDKTYQVEIPSRKITMTVYAAPNGTTRGMQGEHKFTSHWEVNDKGEVCISYKDKMKCRQIMLQEGVYKKFKVNEQGERVVLVVYHSFVDGNVHHY
ncbi:hypothetical protein [sulfur-oxidizing endosymbiont of Gigantopelta aegis]|uniref:hypothetical protein n=1 Tax=sulfur-oxidizing endosymbiont of Gigantopelta aegis TaxID=2794934 RepID=UPI0018DCC1D6|nr:hypothetical protein [sulfur-oxidizing endosymbiont of Gigantopelta aegis]